MINELVNAVKDVAEKIDGVKSFRYDGIDKINAQNESGTIQIFFEDDILINYLVTKDLIKVSFNVDILDKMYQDDEQTLDEIHNYTFKAGVVILKYLEKKYQNIISVYDYSFMTISDYTDDNLYGVRMSVDLIMPSPINMCNIDDFIDEDNKYKEYKDMDIDINIPSIDINTLNINPISLKKNGQK